MAHRPSSALLSALACAAFATLVWAVAFHTDTGNAADVAAYAGFVSLEGSVAEVFASYVAGLCNAGPYAVLSCGIVLTGLAFRGPRHAAAAAALLVVPCAVTQVLKPMLAVTRMGLGPDGRPAVDAASWPSGHSTAAMAIALAAVIVAPGALRAVVAVAGGLFAIAVGYSVVLLGWHLPSDVLGGFAVAGAGAGLATAALWATDRRPAVAAPRLQLPGAWVLLALIPAAAVIAAAVARVAVTLPSAEHQAAFLAIAGAIVALPLMLSGVAAGPERT